MDVFLVPVSADRHELYCESDVVDEAEPQAAEETSWWRRQIARFRAAVAEAEAERRRQDRGEAHNRRGIAAWVMARIAEAVAEQRLLWRIRQETAAMLVHPLDMNGDAALATMRKEMTVDVRRHLRWSLIDGVLAIILGPGRFFIPGPNVVGWYFFFRAIGHFFSWKGARQGLLRVTWTTQASSDLTAIRQILAAGGPECLSRLDEVGARLGLAHLAAHVNRVSRGRRK
jgi:hypothetical protein